MPDGLAGLLAAWVLAITSLGSTATPTVDSSRPPTFPVAGPVRYSAFHHDYPAADVFARCGARVVAPVDGTVLEVARTDRWDPATDRGADRGGLAFSIEGADGVRYYGSHLRSLEPGLRKGAVLRSGDPVGRVGSSGDARGIDCHLHFGISPVCRGTGDWRVRRGAVAPYPFLRSWQHGGTRSPATAAALWQRRHGCG